jgi:hypothetical protein
LETLIYAGAPNRVIYFNFIFLLFLRAIFSAKLENMLKNLHLPFVFWFNWLRIIGGKGISPFGDPRLFNYDLQP